MTLCRFGPLCKRVKPAVKYDEFPEDCGRSEDEDAAGRKRDKLGFLVPAAEERKRRAREEVGLLGED